MSHSPTLAEILEAAVEAGTTRLRVALPARVEYYDSFTQRADVQPLIQSIKHNLFGDRGTDTLPVVTRCPVVMPFAGGMALTFPVQTGDLGLLIIADYSIDKWAGSRGKQIVDPGFDHSHNLTDGIFIPGLVGGANPRQTRPAEGTVFLGADGAPGKQGAALGSVLDSYLADLRTWLVALAAHVSYSLPFTDAPPATPTTQSATVKITP